MAAEPSPGLRPWGGARRTRSRGRAGVAGHDDCTCSRARSASSGIGVVAITRAKTGGGRRGAKGRPACERACGGGGAPRPGSEEGALRRRLRGAQGEGRRPAVQTSRPRGRARPSAHRVPRSVRICEVARIARCAYCSRGPRTRARLTPREGRAGRREPGRPRVMCPDVQAVLARTDGMEARQFRRFM